MDEIIATLDGPADYLALPEAEPTPQAYLVNEGVHVEHGGRIYEAGEIVELTPAEAAVHGDGVAA